MKGFAEIEPLFPTGQFRKIIEVLTPFIDETDDLAERAEQYSMLASMSLADISTKIARQRESLPDAPDDTPRFEGQAYEETKRYYQLCVLNAIAAHSPHTDYYKYSYASFLARYWADPAEAAIILRSISLENLQIEKDKLHHPSHPILPLYKHLILSLQGVTLVLSDIAEGESFLLKAYTQDLIDEVKWCNLNSIYLLIQHHAVLSKNCKAFLTEMLSRQEECTEEMLGNFKALREHDNA